jgi:hypothetical protein
MLVNLEQEVRDILIPICHSFESFDFVVNSFCPRLVSASVCNKPMIG